MSFIQLQFLYVTFQSQAFLLFMVFYGIGPIPLALPPSRNKKEKKAVFAHVTPPSLCALYATRKTDKISIISGTAIKLYLNETIKTKYVEIERSCTNTPRYEAVAFQILFN